MLYSFVSTTGLKTCSDGPCQNGSTCIDLSWGGVECLCMTGDAGEYCERTYIIAAHIIVSTEGNVKSTLNKLDNTTYALSFVDY